MSSRLARLVIPAIASILVVACGSSEEPAAESKSVTRGAFTVTTEARGRDLVSRASKAGSDESLTITFERDANRARIEPRFGQAQTVSLAKAPGDVDAANELLLQPLSFAADKAAGGVTTKAVNPPSPTCTNPCFDACDTQFSDPAQNAACRFGCSTACVK
jgi:hypothetical protein